MAAAKKKKRKEDLKARRKERRKLVKITWPQEPREKPKLPTIVELERDSKLGISGFEDDRCLVWTVNGKKSPKRMNSLETCVASQRRPPDIIAIQDPPPKFAFKSFGSYGHWYRAADVGDERQELTRDDDPSTYPYRIPHDRNERPKKAVKDLCKVAFLVHNSLKGCRITEAKGKNRGLHATLHVTLRSGHTIAFHNVYNHYNSIDVAELGKSMMSTDKAHVMVGDLNLHHPDWAGDELEWHKVEKQAKLLVERFQDASMECLNDGGITYSRSADVDRYASVLDLVYVKDVLKDQAVYKILENIPGYLSDHRISSVSIDVNMERRTGIRYHWDATPKDEFEERVTELLQDIEIAGLDDADAVNSALKTIITQVLEPAIKELVPVTQLYQPEPKYRPKVSPDATKRTTDWRESMEKKAAGPRGIFNFAKQVHNWSVPRRLAYTPDFKVGTETFHHNHEKADKYVECTWPSSRLKGPPLKPTFEQDSDRPEFASPPPKPHFPLPFLDPNRKTKDPPEDSVTLEEVEKALAEVPIRKARGVDGLAYEALKMCRKPLAPFLQYIFNACFRLRIHPDHFKDSITILIKKPGKAADEPNSYRPIALLNTLGKIFERFIADRLKELVIKHDLLPFAQFGAPGRSTTGALECLNNTVYRGWSLKRRVSLLGLDISGAYDHIDRTQLLERLIAMGIPDWIVQIVWSFLSDRRTFVHMPGYDGGEYWIDVGIPQGSPLSPLLFLFYAAPLLTDFFAGYSKKAVTLLSYVDDTYIVVSSKTVHDNCIVMADIHQKMADWAKQSNLHFAPAKYHVMHFVKPGTSGSTELPPIPEFADLPPKLKAKILCETLVILGVTYDCKMSWIPHIREVQRKVRVDLANFDRFVAGTWGANYIQRRDLYKGKLLAKIGYAAAAWFLHDPTKTELEGGIRWGLTKVATHMLEQLQREILKSLTRARAFTPSIAMENEFHVLPILLKLHQLAMNHRCRQYGSADYKLLDEALEIKDPYRGCTQDRKEMAMHPYAHLRALAGLHVRTIREEEQHSLSEPAFAESWADPKKRGEWIKKFNFRVVFHHANIAYKLYLNLRMLSRQPMHPTHKADFGDHILQYYVGLKPAQTTMGIGLRTGNLPLKSNWQWCQMNGITDNRCPLCEKAVHTAEHLLCHCTALETERGFLRSAVGRLDWHSLVTKDLEITTAWAIAFFGIDQFKWCLDDKDFQFPRGRRVHISFRN